MTWLGASTGNSFASTTDPSLAGGSPRARRLRRAGSASGAGIPIAPVQDPVLFDERNKFDRAVGAVGDPPSPPPQSSDELAVRIELDMKPAEQVVGAIGGIDV